MPEDRSGEPAGRQAGRHAGRPAAEEPGAPVPLGRDRRRAAGTGSMAGTAASVISLSAARPGQPDRRGPGLAGRAKASSAGRDTAGPAARTKGSTAGQDGAGRDKASSAGPDGAGRAGSALRREAEHV
jgi:hypothetical protein